MQWLEIDLITVIFIYTEEFNVCTDMKKKNNEKREKAKLIKRALAH